VVQTKELSGTQKAAVFIMQMDRARAAKVLRSMRESEVAEITAEIARLRNVGADQADAVLDEFVAMAEARRHVASGGLEFARTLLEETLGGQKASEIFSRLAATMIDVPFEFLAQADPRQVLSFIQDEHPQTIALVLAHMPPEMAAMVMGGLSESLQRDVAHRLAVMDRTSPDVVDHVEEVLQRKLSSILQPTEMSAVGGVQALVDIINRSDRATERLILEALESSDSGLADEVRQRMFVFEDITTLDDKAVQLILRQVDGKELAVALKGVRQDVREKIMRNMSERAAANLAEEIDMLGAVRIKTVEEGQGAIVRIIRTLEESGQILLSRGTDEFVE
jgi:flagellar motor switch protein FliG